MRKRLTKSGNSVALVLDRRLLEAARVDPDGEVEVSTNGDCILISPIRDRKRTAKLEALSGKINAKYAGVFKRLAE